jgi:hypothetical protein
MSPFLAGEEALLSRSDRAMGLLHLSLTAAFDSLSSRDRPEAQLLVELAGRQVFFRHEEQEFLVPGLAEASCALED